MIVIVILILTSSFFSRSWQYCYRWFTCIGNRLPSAVIINFLFFFVFIYVITGIYRRRIRNLRSLYRQRNYVDGWTTSRPLSTRWSSDDGRNAIPTNVIAGRRLVQSFKPFDQRTLDARRRGAPFEHKKPQETDCRCAAGKRVEHFKQYIVIRETIDAVCACTSKIDANCAWKICTKLRFPCSIMLVRWWGVKV